MREAITPLFVTLVANINGVSVMHRLFMVGGDKNHPGSGRYMLSLLGTRRPTPFDPFTTVFHTKANVASYVSGLIDHGVISTGKLNNQNLTHRVQGVVSLSPRSFESIALQLANTKPTTQWPMSVQTKVSHVEKAIEQFKQDYGYTES
jgi:hypothetical protein